MKRLFCVLSLSLILSACKNVDKKETKDVSITGVEAMKKLCTWLKVNNEIADNGDVDWVVYENNSTAPTQDETRRFQYQARISGVCLKGTESLRFEFSSSENAEKFALSNNQIDRSLVLSLALNPRKKDLLGGSRFLFDQKENRTPQNNIESLYQRRDFIENAFQSVFIEQTNSKELLLKFQIKKATINENAREDWAGGAAQVYADNLTKALSYTGNLKISLKKKIPMSFTVQASPPEGLPLNLKKKLNFFSFDPVY